MYKRHKHVLRRIAYACEVYVHALSFVLCVYVHAQGVRVPALPTNLCSLTGAAMWVWVPDSNKFQDCCAEADGSESFSYVVGLVFRVLDGESYDVAVLFLCCCLIGHMMSLRISLSYFCVVIFVGESYDVALG